MKVYTCPMHPEIEKHKVGRCPKCGMKLVLKDEAQNHSFIETGQEKGLGNLTWKSYLPLIVIFTLILLTAFTIAIRQSASSSIYQLNVVSNFMAGFFIVFAGFKLMDLEGFAQGYSTYDLLAKKWSAYGYIYPFIELFFGISMVLGFAPKFVLLSEIFVMGFSGIGVATKLLKGEKFQCACLGTFLKVPLTRVTLIEDFGMVVLAAILLLH